MCKQNVYIYICNHVVAPVIVIKRLNSFTPEQNGRLFTGDISKCIFTNEFFFYFDSNSLKFVPKGPIDKKSTLVWVMAWRWTGNKPNIIWPNADPVHRRIYAALGGDELKNDQPTWVKKSTVGMFSISYSNASLGQMLQGLAVVRLPDRWVSGFSGGHQ